MTRPDRPPGRKRSGPRQVTTPAGSRPGTTSSPPSTEVVLSVLRCGDGPVLARLLELRHRYGYFTRRELDAVTGAAAPPGRWECAGEFGPDGRLAPHCGRDAS